MKKLKSKRKTKIDWYEVTVGGVTVAILVISVVFFILVA